jgi:hypothetical protein
VRNERHADVVAKSKPTMEASMERTILRTALDACAALALLGGAVLLPAPAAAGERQAYLGDGAPATLQEVRRRIYVVPAYGYDPYYVGSPLTTRRRPPTMRPRWLTRRRLFMATCRRSVTAMGWNQASPSSVRAAASMSAISRPPYGAVV